MEKVNWFWQQNWCAPLWLLFPAGQQVILLCDSWYPKGEVLSLVDEFSQLEMICNVRRDTALYDLPAPRTGKRGRPRIRGERLDLHSLQLTKPEGSNYYLGSRKVITNLWKGQPVHLYVTKTFWSFCIYWIRSAIGIERLVNLVCISYAAVRLLPYYSSDFAQYRGDSPQEVRYQIGEKIRMNLIVASLEQIIETMKNNQPVKTALKAYARSQGYQ